MGALQFWVVLVHSVENMIPSRTDHFNISIPLDRPRQAWRGPALERHRHTQAPAGWLWDCGYPELLKEFHAVATLAGVAILTPMPSGCRHGGASHDRALGSKLLPAGQQCGAWRSFSSVLRYDKHGRRELGLQKLPMHVRRQIEESQERALQLFAKCGALR